MISTLNGLINRDGEPLVVKLTRTPGRKDSEYMHLFSGPIDVEARAQEVLATKPQAASRHSNIDELTERVARLEEEVAELKALLS